MDTDNLPYLRINYDNGDVLLTRGRVIGVLSGYLTYRGREFTTYAYHVRSVQQSDTIDTLSFLSSRLNWR